MNKEQYGEILENLKTVEVAQENFKNWFLEQESERMDLFDNGEEVFCSIYEAEDFFNRSQSVYKYEKSASFSPLSLT